MSLLMLIIRNASCGLGSCSTVQNVGPMSHHLSNPTRRQMRTSGNSVMRMVTTDHHGSPLAAIFHESDRS